jgi:tetrathionate reductase subunit B
MAKYVMVLETGKCINCRACVVACQMENQVPMGKARNWVRQAPDDGPGLRHFQPGNCMQCDEPTCVSACPTGATWKDEADGIVKVNTELCIGCGSCVGACPYSARYLDPRLGVVDKCTYCTRLLEKGQEPACVAVCPTRVRIFGDASDPSDPVHALVRDPGLKQIVAARTDTKPAMFFKGHTVPTDWPRDVAPPLPVRVWRSVMTPVTSSVGAMTLIGIGLVALRQLFDRKTRNAGGKEAGKEE